MVRERKIIQDMVVPTKKKAVPQQLPFSRSQESHQVSEKTREINQSIERAVLPIEIIEPVRNNQDYKNRKSNHKKSNFGIWFVSTALLLVLLVTIGGFFTKLTLVIETKKVEQPLDREIVLTKNNTAPGLFFGTISETVIDSVVLENLENEDIRKAELVSRVENKAIGLRQRLSQDVPDSKMIFPLIIAEPVVFTKNENDLVVELVASKTVTLIIVDKQLLAQLVYKNSSQDGTAVFTITDSRDMLATTSLLVSSVEIPETIPVRLTGTPLLTTLIAPQEITRAVQGKKISEIKERVTSIPEIQSFSLKIRPFWRTMAPSNQNLIRITVN
jgi:hypothetical protein